MPRAGWVKPETDQRLSDHISIGVLTRVFPPDLVDRVVKEAGRTEQRQRLLPARVVVYYVLGLALFSPVRVRRGHAPFWSRACLGNRAGRTRGTSHKSGAVQSPHAARSRALEALYRHSAVPLADKATKGAFYRSWRLMSIDGTCLDVADTSATNWPLAGPARNARTASEHFPRSGSSGLPNAVPMPSSMP